MNGATSILTAPVTPELARRSWPRWLALGIAMLAVAVLALALDGGGARLLLGAIGLFLVLRGAVLLRAGAVPRSPDASARGLGVGAVAAGIAAGAAAGVPTGSAGLVLLVGVPVVLLLVAGALITRRGVARRGGLALLVWSVLVAGLLAVTAAVQGLDRAAELATVVTALAVAVLAVPVLLGAVNLRAAASRPAPAARPAGCGGCACAAGGCGALG